MSNFVVEINTGFHLASDSENICNLQQMVDIGVIIHPESYFRDFWNVIDFIVVLIAMIPLGYAML